MNNDPHSHQLVVAMTLSYMSNTTEMKGGLWEY